MVYRLCLVTLLVFCSGCVTTRATVTCNKTIDLTGQPDNGRINVGVRLELFEQELLHLKKQY